MIVKSGLEITQGHWK